LAMNPAAACCRHRRVIARCAERINAAASSPVRDEDVMLKKRIFGRKNRLLFELVVGDAIVAGDHHPTLRARFSEPD
jgi:hypothetical protein